jgi:hypothetical protein
MIVRIVVQVIFDELLTRFHGDLQLMPQPSLCRTRNAVEYHILVVFDVGSQACAFGMLEFPPWDICMCNA